MVNVFFRRALGSPGVKSEEKQSKKAGMLILLFKVVKLGWVLGHDLDVYVPPWSSNFAACFRKKN